MNFYKFALMFSSEAIVYTIDEQTGGLEVSHSLIVSSQVYPGEVSAVECMKWSPDGCALALCWNTGGFSIWSTFGALLVCSLGWNYGLHVDLSKNNPLYISSMVCIEFLFDTSSSKFSWNKFYQEWSIEGYQLWMINKTSSAESASFAQESILQYEFLKSALTVNPCMVTIFCDDYR